jgi:hypothetical protein
MALPFFVGLAKAAAPYVIPAIAGAINQKNENEAAMDAYNKQRAAEKEDQANKFVDMRNAAQKAGFNPLTVLRATGGAGFGGTNAVMPVMSKQNFLATFASQAAGQYLENKANAPIDAYNEQIRKLELEQRQLDIKLSKKQINNIGKTDAMYNSLQKQIEHLYEKNEAPQAKVAINKTEIVSEKAPAIKEAVIGPTGFNTNVYKGDDASEMITSWFKGQIIKGQIKRESRKREERLNPPPLNRGGLQMPTLPAPESFGQLSRAITVMRYDNNRMNEVIHGGTIY